MRCYANLKTKFKTISVIKFNNSEIIDRLRRIISEKLSRLIPGDYILADAPYYHNIGDILIWQGIHDFCKTLPGRNLGTYDFITFNFPKISVETTIILTGGGNFGDLWRGFQDFRLEVTKRYPDNRIVMLPQSVWYQNKNIIKADSIEFTKHKNLHFYARDNYSYNFFKKHYSTVDIHLVPDMALFIDDKILQRYRNNTKPQKLFLRRLDKELDASLSVIPNISEYAVHDWPTYERQDSRLKLIKRMQGISYRSRNINILNSLTATLTAKIAQQIVRKHLLKTGLSFLSTYSEIVTTRLHTMILAFMLNLPVEYIDNTTGKLSAFYNTWLADCRTIKRYNIHG